MCGICGFVSTERDAPLPFAVVTAMRDVISHRGPDDSGAYFAPGVFLGSRRLAILDLSDRGRMPMSDPEERYHIVYNGEVYNFRELRANLQSRGYRFRSNTDTEVILQSFAASGPAMLETLNGMFAFAIWDAHEQRLFLARDRLGVKPLYYAIQDGALYFASEQKALLAAGVRTGFDPACWEELLSFRYVAGERTVLKRIRRLLPGHMMTWGPNGLEIRRWWRLDEKAREAAERPPADAHEWFGQTFDDAVQLRRISDVPLGVLLSGGLDSSTVAAALAKNGGAGSASFTVRFEQKHYDEGPLAREVAERCGLEPHDLSLDPRGLVDHLEEASWLSDEPLAHGNDTHILAISRYAKPRVTVLLSGEGADETLGGYVRYEPLRYPGLLTALRPVLPCVTQTFRVNGRAGKLGRLLALGSMRSSVLYNSADTLPQDLQVLGLEPRGAFEYRSSVLSEAERLYPEQPVRQAMYLDQHTYLCSLLDRNDRMTMGASIECRVPFLDYRLVEGLAGLGGDLFFSGRQGKAILRRSLGGRLPDSVLGYRKWGFAVPWNEYLRTVPGLRERAAGLPDASPIGEGPIDRSKLKDVLRAFFSGDDRPGMLIRQLVMLAVWHDVYFSRCAGSAPRVYGAGR